jgi:hypothetical protein
MMEKVSMLSTMKGMCYVLFAYDIGLSINLDEAERHITAIKQRSRIRHNRRARTTSIIDRHPYA